MNRHVVRILIRAYPRRWRERYADEFTAFLESQPNGLRPLVDILVNGFRERLRSMNESGTIMSSSRMKTTVLVVLLTTAALTATIIQYGLGRRAESGADIVLLGPGTSTLLAMQGATIPASVGSEVASRVAGIKAVSPVVFQVDSGFWVVLGIDPASFQAVNGRFKFKKGGLFKEPGDIVVDDFYANSKNLAVGDDLTVLKHRFTISGIVERGYGARLWVSLATLQDLAGASDKATAFFVKLSDSNRINRVMTDISGLLPDYRLISTRSLPPMASQ
jgi:hypothetical protein